MPWSPHPPLSWGKRVFRWSLIIERVSLPTLIPFSCPCSGLQALLRRPWFICMNPCTRRCLTHFRQADARACKLRGARVLGSGRFAFDVGARIEHAGLGFDVTPLDVQRSVHPPASCRPCRQRRGRSLVWWDRRQRASSPRWPRSRAVGVPFSAIRQPGHDATPCRRVLQAAIGLYIFAAHNHSFVSLGSWFISAA